MSTYTSRVLALIEIAKRLNNEDLISQMNVLRKQSDVMEIIGHPRNPTFFPERLEESDPSVNMYNRFKLEYKALSTNIFNLVDKHYGIEHTNQLAGMVFLGEIEKVKEYLRANLSQQNSFGIG